MSRNFLSTSVLVLGSLALASCGGGSSSASNTISPPPPPVSSGPTWTKGVFDAASSFKDQCQNPRTGTDIEGNSFPDRVGSTLIEKFWLRSWTNETYLWNRDVEDIDPDNADTRVQYFNKLRTNEVTASGEDLDDFHFSEPTSEFLERRNSSASASYGISLVAFKTDAPGRDFRVRYTEPDSPASAVVNGQVNMPRGARILEVDGVDLVDGSDVDTLNAGLFPANAGESHTFVVQDDGSSETRSITLVSENISPKPVNRYSVLNQPDGSKVGYMLFNTFSPFSSEEDLANAVSALAAEGIDDLILDLRYNGGGLLAVASQLSYQIAGPSKTNGRTFELLQFNEDAGNRNPVTGDTNGPIPFYDEGLGFSLDEGTNLSSLNLNRVFILSTGRTCSASEAVINGLQGIDFEVVLIGDTTCGKPYGFYPQDNCGETYYTIQFRGVNDKGFGDFSDGFVPMNSNFTFGEKLSGCVVADDLSKELGDETEALLATVLEYRSSGTCPSVATASAKPQVSFRSSEKVGSTALTPMDDFLANNLDMRMPEGR